MSDIIANEYTILVVDDHPISLSALAEYLESCSYNVLVARDGQDALETVQRHLPDLILLDVMLPDMNGFEVCRQLKAQQRSKDIPVIFITALSETDHKIMGFEVGAVDYITKPFQAQEISSRIDTHLHLHKLSSQLEEQVQQRTAELTQAMMQAQRLNQELKRTNTQLKYEIIERRQIEEALTTSQNRLHTVMNSMEDMVFVLDEQTSLTDYYDSGNLHTYPLESLMGKKCSEMDLPPHIYEPLQRAIKKNRTGESDEFEFQVDQEEKPDWYAAKFSPILDRDAFTGSVVTIQNITHRKQIEQEKDRLLAQVNQHSQQLRAMSARLAETQENERKKMARELHDRVGQNLSTMGFILNLIRDRIASLLPGPDVEAFLARVDDVLEIIRQTTDDVRNVMAELRPAVLDDYGLGTALSWYGERYSKQIGISVNIQSDELTKRLPAKVETTLFRITQEALTNVAKHAQATEVKITLTKTDKITLSIQDNGVGFDQTTTEYPGKGWGILNMTERAMSVGGRCRIETGPGQGTTVTVEV